AVVDQLRANGMALIIATEDDLHDVESCGRVVVFKDGAPIGELGEGRTEGDLLARMEGVAS
ncbi:MAG: hypothetical protein ACRDZX_04835, partial [Acidimicrobiales bacterium]